MTRGTGTVAPAVPRVRDIPPDQELFESHILRKQRGRGTLDAMFLRFVEGLAPRDFEPALRRLVGEDPRLSPSTISRLAPPFKAQYEAFDRRDFSNRGRAPRPLLGGLPHTTGSARGSDPFFFLLDFTAGE